MVFQFTPLHLTLGGIERSNQDHQVLIWLCIIDNQISLVQHRQLDSGAVRPRGLLFTYPTYDARVCQKSSARAISQPPAGHFAHMGEEEINCGKSRSCCNCKAIFTRYRHQLLLDEVEMPSHTQIRHIQLLKKKITKWLPAAIYVKNRQPVLFHNHRRGTSPIWVRKKLIVAKVDLVVTVRPYLLVIGTNYNCYQMKQTCPVIQKYVICNFVF